MLIDMLIAMAIRVSMHYMNAAMFEENGPKG